MSAPNVMVRDEPKPQVDVMVESIDGAVKAVGVEGGEEGAASPLTSIRRVSSWALQMAASSSWVVSVIIYDSWETGDVFQMLAASAWTASNLLALPDVLP